MHTVLITGANGFVGSYLARALSGKANIIATGAGPCRFTQDADTLRYESLDITDRDAVMQLVAREQPTVIVHSAAISKPDVCEQDHELADRINVEGTRHLLEAAESLGAHFLFLSTDFVFDGKRGMYREDDPVAPVNYYGETKVRAEELVKRYDGPWSVARTVLVYGASRGGRGNLLTMVAGALAEGRPLRIFNDQLRTPTYVEDLVDGLIRIIDRKATGIFHLSGADQRTPYQMAVETAAHLGLDASLITAVTEDTFKEPAKRPQKTGFDISKARKELGYAPITFGAGLRKTFE
jgi:dTDP-4-dehydrorhamnose reductase